MTHLFQFTDEELRDELARRERPHVHLVIRGGITEIHLPHSSPFRMTTRQAAALRDLLENVAFCSDVDYEGWQEVPRSFRA